MHGHGTLEETKNEKNVEIKNKWYKGRNIMPYIVKILVFLFVVGVAVFSVENINSMALNVLTLVLTLLVDAWILRTNMKTVGFSMYIQAWHRFYIIITVFVLLLTSVCAFGGEALQTIPYNSLSIAVFLFLVLICICSVFFEACCAMLEND